jgi:formylglycine-generating enzyme required for sulfatase activity
MGNRTGFRDVDCVASHRQPGRDDIAEGDHLGDFAVQGDPQHAVMVPVGDDEPAAVGNDRILEARGDEEVRGRRMGDGPGAEVGHDGKAVRAVHPVDADDIVQARIEVRANAGDQRVGGPVEEGDIDHPTADWDRVFDDNEKHVVILGQPGAGKSTLLDYLILVFSGQINHPLRSRLQSPLPIFVRLRDLGKVDAKQTLLSLIESPDSIGLKNVPSGYFERHLKSGKCIVLLDGLDEVLDETCHDHVVKEIQSFANEYAGNWIFVTCRIAGWHGQLPNFKQYTVREFDRDDVHQFIGAWYREVTRTEEINRLGVSPKADAIQEAEAKAYQTSLKQADLLWGALLKNEGLLRIARTPLILSLVTLVHKNRTTDLPKGRARLYRECLEILLDLWDAKDKGLTITDAPSLNDKLFVLKTIGYHFVENGLLEMDSEGLESLVTPLLPSLTKSIGASSLINQIYERSGVLVEQAIGKYGFAHRALHDYLAASYIAEQSLDSILINHAGEERWREVILIAIGLVSPKQRSNTLLESLVSQSDESPASLALAGWSLAEDIQVREDLRASVKNKILQKLTDVESVGDFSLLSEALADTDAPAFQNWINNVLTGQDSILRMRVLNNLLPELGPEKSSPFVSTLVEILADPHMESGTRMQAAMVLGRIKPLAHVELWKALETARLEKDHWLKAAATWAWCELGRYQELGLVKIPAGEFLMGSSEEDQSAYDDEKPQHTVYLPAFYIGKYPVTVAQFRSFAEKSGQSINYEKSLQGVENHPVVYVSWQDAMNFTEWHGMTLPSEAQWEKAARGTQGYIYPWGNRWENGLANTVEYWNSGIRGFWLKRRRKANAETTPVGYFSPRGDSPFGCADMSGNVWEWTSSIFKEYPYRADEREDIIADGFRVLRGGSFLNILWDARCADRVWYRPLLSDVDIGFRVCVSPIIKSGL